MLRFILYFQWLWLSAWHVHNSRSIRVLADLGLWGGLGQLAWLWWVVVGRCKRNRLQIWRNLSFTGTTCFSFSGHLPIWEACGRRRDKSALKSRRTAQQHLEIILLISGGRNSFFALWDYSCFSEDSGQWFGRLLEQQCEGTLNTVKHTSLCKWYTKPDAEGERLMQFAKLKVKTDIWLKIIPFWIISRRRFISMVLFQFCSLSLWK